VEKQIVVFALHNELFGIDIACVEGIVKMQEITPIPFSPNYLKGITSLRGSVLPVIDLATRFNMAETELTRESRIVVVFFAAQKFGMIVSSVSEVLTIEDNIIEPPPPMVSNINTEFLSGIARVNEKLILLLDLSHTLENITP
jgi:purine-binding chemotaxis protein CheW